MPCLTGQGSLLHLGLSGSGRLEDEARLVVLALFSLILQHDDQPNTRRKPPLLACSSRQERSGGSSRPSRCSTAPRHCEVVLLLLPSGTAGLSAPSWARGGGMNLILEPKLQWSMDRLKWRFSQPRWVLLCLSEGDHVLLPRWLLRSLRRALWPECGPTAKATRRGMHEGMKKEKGEKNYCGEFKISGPHRRWTSEHILLCVACVSLWVFVPCVSSWWGKECGWDVPWVCSGR